LRHPRRRQAPGGTRPGPPDHPAARSALGGSGRAQHRPRPREPHSDPGTGAGRRPAGDPVKLHGRAYLVVTTIAVLFSINAGGPSPYLAGYLTAGTLLLAALWTFALQRGLAVTIAAEGRTFTVGDRAQIILRIENDILVPAPWLELRDR